MDVSVYLPLYLGVTLAVVAPAITRMIPPRTAVWWLSAAAVTSAAACCASLVMIGFTGLGRTPFVADEGHWSVAKWRRSDPVDVWTAIAAGAVLAACATLFAWACAREFSARRRVRRLGRGLPGSGAVVFVDDDAPHAYALDGRRPRIVVTRGLLRRLRPAERRAVLCHEHAHVRHHHHAHLRVVRLAAALNPLLLPFVPAAALAVERWADEETAEAVGDRALVARALLRAALAGTDHAGLPHGMLAHATGDVTRRVSALLQAPPRARWPVMAATSILLAATIAAPGVAAHNLDTLLAAASSTSPPARVHTIAGAGSRYR